jgi:alcohol dehydrogenase class IV
MRFEFATATRIIVGPGMIREIGALAAGLGGRALVVTGSQPERVGQVFDLLDEKQIAHVTFPVSGEPTITTAQAGVDQVRASACEMVISIGGGSVIDAGKAVAALATNPGDALNYLEVIGSNKPLIHPPMPFIAIPTTAGTGAEVTRNAVLASPEHNLKVSLRSPLMLPRIALVDPELTHSMSPATTAATGLDALTQLVEPYVCNVANPITDALCREGMQRAASALRRAYHYGDDSEARYDMAVASLLGGLALANARLGAVHGFAGPIGGMFPAPHGAVCGRLLPFVMEANINALQERQPESDALWRYMEIAAIVTGDAEATAGDGLAWVRDLCGELQIPKLSSYGITEADIPTIAEKSAGASSMQGNPVKLTAAELEAVLRAAL